MKKRIIALFCTVAILLALPAVAIEQPKEFRRNNAEVYWSSDWSEISSLFNCQPQGNQMPSNAELNGSISHSLELMQNADGTFDAKYTFEFDGTGSNSEVVLYGTAQKYEYSDSFAFYLAKTKGQTIVNGVDCVIYANVQKEIGNNDMNAGITIVPESAQDFDDIITMCIGDTVVTSNMVDFDGKKIDNKNPAVMDSSSSEEERASSYSLRASTSSNFQTTTMYGITGAAQYLKYYYNAAKVRVALTVNTYLDLLRQRITDNYDVAASVTVDNITMKLKADSNYSPKIDGFYSLPSNKTTSLAGIAESGSTIIDYINTLLGEILPAGSGTAISALISLLKQISSDNQTKVETEALGAESWARFSFPAGPYFTTVTDFDDAPLPVELSLDTPRAGNGYFAAQSSVEYFAAIRPYSNPVAVSFVTYASGTAETAYMPLYVPT